MRSRHYFGATSANAYPDTSMSESAQKQGRNGAAKGETIRAITERASTC